MTAVFSAHRICDALRRAELALRIGGSRCICSALLSTSPLALLLLLLLLLLLFRYIVSPAGDLVDEEIHCAVREANSAGMPCWMRATAKIGQLYIQ